MRDTRARYWTVVTLSGFAVFTVIAVLGAISTLLYWTHTDYVPDPLAFVANRFLEEYTCALFVPPLFWLAERFPLTLADRRRRNAAILFAAVLSFVLVKYAVMMPLYRLWTGQSAGSYELLLLDNFVPVTFDFAAITGVAHALAYYRAVEEREHTAAALKTQLVQARLDTLRGQLHPHFLFNALNAAATLMHEDVDAADRMLAQLGDLLRLSLERGQAEITLGEELDLASRYLAIMHHRFSDRLRVHMSLEPDVKEALVPTFLMQPLIENALEHGIARRPGPGSIDISARRVDATLELAVTDDGPGPPDALIPGIGLSNTRERLEQLYGGASAFSLEPAPGGGARAVVRIPFRECRES